LEFLLLCSHSVSALLQVAFPMLALWSPDRLRPTFCELCERCPCWPIKLPPWEWWWRRLLLLLFLGETPQEVPGCIGRRIRSVSLMLTRDIRDFFWAATVVGEFFRTGICKNIPSTLLFLRLFLLLLLREERDQVFFLVSLNGPEKDSDLVLASCSRSLLSLVRYSHRHLGLLFS
jgi:hypothetical protein